jgi:hypothetical protein
MGAKATSKMLVKLTTVLFSGMNGDLDLNNGNDTIKVYDVNVPGRKSDYEPMACAYILLVMAIYW